MPGRPIAALAAALFVMLLTASPAAAHGELISSEPPANASLPSSPDEASLLFTEPLDLANVTVDSP